MCFMSLKLYSKSLLKSVLTFFIESTIIIIYLQIILRVFGKFLFFSSYVHVFLILYSFSSRKKCVFVNLSKTFYIFLGFFDLIVIFSGA